MTGSTSTSDFSPVSSTTKVTLNGFVGRFTSGLSMYGLTPPMTQFQVPGSRLPKNTAQCQIRRRRGGFKGARPRTWNLEHLLRRLPAQHHDGRLLRLQVRGELEQVVLLQLAHVLVSLEELVRL